MQNIFLIQNIAKHSKKASWFLLLLFYFDLVASGFAYNTNKTAFSISRNFTQNSSAKGYVKRNSNNTVVPTESDKRSITTEKDNRPFIGGPTAPEAATFKTVGSDNLVNLASGDFSYSIPLLDVGGYPVNLFYSGGIEPEQEASWVGLGWNLNPGTVNRGLRGIPDDFNGTDKMTQIQNVKPNKTYGGDLGFDMEFVGLKALKLGAGTSLGFSYNNYLGPALEIGARTSITLAAAESAKSEKAAPAKDSTNKGASITAGIDMKLNSRSGMTLSPSLSASVPLASQNANLGLGISTSYNSRTGLKELNFSGSASFSSKTSLDGKGPNSAMSSSQKYSASLASSSISFAKPSFVPSLRLPLEYRNYSGHIEVGWGAWLMRYSLSAMGYYSESKVPLEWQLVHKPMVGYMYMENANADQNAVMDFNRLNDGEVTPNTPIISAPQYNYDVWNIQGEGTGGAVRAYRNDPGFVRDNLTESKDGSFSAGLDIGSPFHIGFNWTEMSTPTKISGWEDNNNTLRNTLRFTSPASGTSFENVYFRNPSEATVTTPELLTKFGGEDLVRFNLSGTGATPRIDSKLELFDKKTTNQKNGLLAIANSLPVKREKRTQVITMLTAAEASVIGLDKFIKSYHAGSGLFNNEHEIVYDSISRTSDYRKAHHISEIDVLEPTGMRYVYGIPVYNKTQKDFTFSVSGTPDEDNIVSYYNDEPTTGSRHIANSSKIDGYVQCQETPAYANSFLLTGLISPDYVDVTGNGITEDDLGTAVKFNYTQTSDPSHLHRWRTPRNQSGGAIAHFNAGLQSEEKDNKANISYGEREVWYLNSIESKAMVAVFILGDREDMKGVQSEMDASIDNSDHTNKRLERIDLYTKAEIAVKGYTDAKPLKSVHFVYSYELCKHTPDNVNDGGKLTLKSVYFSYNGQSRLQKEKYAFYYGDTTSLADNPNYQQQSVDRWGGFKPSIDPETSIHNNPGSLNNVDFPFTRLDKQTADKYAASWNLRKILMPSGAEIEISYESDDYAYVQDRRACNMLDIAGLGNSTSFSTSNNLYNSKSGGDDNYYVYVKKDRPYSTTSAQGRQDELKQRFFEGIHGNGGKKQLAFKLFINNTPKGGQEPLTVYGEYSDFGICTNDSNYFYIHLTPVDGKSPLAKSAIGFLTGNLPGQAFPGYEIEATGIEAFFEMAGGMLDGLKSSFSNVDQNMRGESNAKTIELSKSFIRLANPTYSKLGGGYRVKRVVLKDNWNRMSGQYNSLYGQDYEYTKTEIIDGKKIITSSGVASYEPAIGSEENPFREIVSYSNKLPLASAEYGAIEMPLLEGFYPGASVVYSKVTVRSIHRKGTHGDSTLRSAIGKQVTEYFTARDYPSFSNYTPLKSMDYHKNPFFSLFYKEILNRRTTSQGFLVVTNDMHGKIKSQAAYSESDENTVLSASYHYYKNTGRNGFNDKVDFIYNEESGKVYSGNMGIDVELMTDVRDFRVEGNGFNGQGQIDLFTIAYLTIPIPTIYPLKSYTENRYRSVTCTKLINYHAIEDSVVVMDKGSVTSTKTIGYDSETGNAIVTRTANEFNDPVYNVSYPAYWAYSSCGPAYKNINRKFDNVSFSSGMISSLSQNVIDSSFESGDELFLFKETPDGCAPSASGLKKLWAVDTLKNASSLTSVHKKIVFIDKDGFPAGMSATDCKIIRSGNRNLLNQTIASVTCMENPITVIGSIKQLDVSSASKVISASAMDFKEKWAVDGVNFERYNTSNSTDSCFATSNESEADCNGSLTTHINPYLKGLLGNLRPYHTYTYYGDRAQTNVSTATAIRTDGVITGYHPFWVFNSDHNMIPDFTNTEWVWNSELMRVNSKGQELETRDALNRYTSAQYGYNQSLPVSMTQNARYGESFAENFEDYAYYDNINPIPESCDQRYITFYQWTPELGLRPVLPPSSGLALPVNLIDSIPKAHSGKYALRIPGNVTHEIPIKKNLFADSFNLRFKSGIITGASPASAGTTGSFSCSASGHSVSSSITWGSHGLTVDATDNNAPNFAGLVTYQQQQDCSTRVFASGNYSFSRSAYILGDNYLVSSASCSVTVTITNISTSAQTVLTLASNNNYEAMMGINASSNVYLTCGDYTISSTTTWSLSGWAGGGIEDIPMQASITFADLSIYNFGSSCNYLKPIPATVEMINPIFSIHSLAKKMHFSGWIFNDHASTNDQQYRILNQSGGTITNLMPVGKTIEGWQKFEADFYWPENDSIATLSFSNGNTKSIFLDDVRIHPWEANMKSYVYDDRTLRLSAELDENNYTTFYEYDEEGQLVRVKKETYQGIKTINETRASKQRSITDFAH